MNTIYVIMIIIGFFPFAIAMYKMNRTKQMKMNGIKSTAVVQQLYGISLKGMNRVLIEYRTETGQLISKEIIVAGIPYQVGDSLPIFYDPQNPTKLVLDGGKSYIIIVIFTLLLAAFMIAACFMISNSIAKGEM